MFYTEAQSKVYAIHRSVPCFFFTQQYDILQVLSVSAGFVPSIRIAGSQDMHFKYGQ